MSLCSHAGKPLALWELFRLVGRVPSLPAAGHGNETESQLPLPWALAGATGARGRKPRETPPLGKTEFARDDLRPHFPTRTSYLTDDLTCKKMSEDVGKRTN